MTTKARPPRYRPGDYRLRVERVFNDTPVALMDLLRQIKFDDPVLCLSFLCEQRFDEFSMQTDYTRLMGWMVTTFDMLRRAHRVPDLPEEVMAESAATYVIDWHLTLRIEAKEKPLLLMDAKPPNLAAYLHTVNETGGAR